MDLNEKLAARRKELAEMAVEVPKVVEDSARNKLNNPKNTSAPVLGKERRKELAGKSQGRHSKNIPSDCVHNEIEADVSKEILSPVDRCAKISDQQYMQDSDTNKKTQVANEKKCEVETAVSRSNQSEVERITKIATRRNMQNSEISKKAQKTNDNKIDKFNPIWGIIIFIIGLFSGKILAIFIGLGLAIFAVLSNIAENQKK